MTCVNLSAIISFPLHHSAICSARSSAENEEQRKSSLAGKLNSLITPPRSDGDVFLHLVAWEFVCVGGGEGRGGGGTGGEGTGGGGW